MEYNDNRVILVKIRWNRVLLVLGFIVVLLVGIIFLLPKKEVTIELSSFVGKTKEEVETYLKEQKLELEVEEIYSFDIPEGEVISQEPQEKTSLKENDKVKVVISKGPIPESVYKENNVNELGRIPIMMYHGIVDKPSAETSYTGGNVDKDGYNRTAEAFRGDLEFYYENGYRMIRLDDYIHGNIDVPLGKSPIVLTFDDGREDNFKVTGRDENGNLQIDPNCAVGVLEEYKAKYPDFNVTATFFVNSGLFQQEEYNKEILNWLVDHGYDVGNHTTTHPDFTKISEAKTLEVVGKVYQQLDELLPNRYVKIVALPFGSPYKKTHANFPLIMEGTYEGYSYKTEAALRVGWEADYSPYSSSFDPTFLKRIRAYDNNGQEFDISMAFKQIESSKYVSDGDKETIVYPKESESKLKETYSKRTVAYE